MSDPSFDPTRGCDRRVLPGGLCQCDQCGDYFRSEDEDDNLCGYCSRRAAMDEGETSDAQEYTGPENATKDHAK